MFMLAKKIETYIFLRKIHCSIRNVHLFSKAICLGPTLLSSFLQRSCFLSAQLIFLKYLNVLCIFFIRFLCWLKKNLKKIDLWVERRILMIVSQFFSLKTLCKKNTYNINHCAKHASNLVSHLTC